jgi:hypothetical protein
MRGERKGGHGDDGAPFIGDTVGGGVRLAVDARGGEGWGRGAGPAWRSGGAVWPTAA